jgi:hypothetical protein
MPPKKQTTRKRPGRKTLAGTVSSAIDRGFEESGLLSIRKRR